MKNILLSLLLFLSFYGKTLCQEKVVFYYNANWEITSKEKATYSREAEIDMDRFRLNGPVVDYNLKGKKVMEGYYTNGKKNGEFIFYFPNGNTESKGNYLGNRRTGNWVYFYPNGKLKQSVIIHPKNVWDDLVVIDYFDKAGKQLVKNGTGKWTNDSILYGLFDRVNYKRLTGRFKDSLKVGDWKLVQISNDKLLHIEQFSKGKFVTGAMLTHSFDGYGTTMSEIMPKFPDNQSDKFNSSESFKLDTTVYPSSVLNADVITILKTITGKDYKIKDRKVMYSEGDYGLFEFIGKNIRYPITAQEAKITGKVYVRVTIDPKGNLKEAKLLYGVRKDLDDEALRVVRLLTKWLPELKDDVPVESSLTIPVSFELN